VGFGACKVYPPQAEARATGRLLRLEAKEKGRPMLPGRPIRVSFCKARCAYCGSTFLRPEATGGGAPVGNAAGALASRTITCAGASITFPPVALAI
jgi:hypothetical protein